VELPAASVSTDRRGLAWRARIKGSREGNLISASHSIRVMNVPAARLALALPLLVASCANAPERATESAPASPAGGAARADAARPAYAPSSWAPAGTSAGFAPSEPLLDRRGAALEELDDQAARAALARMQVSGLHIGREQSLRAAVGVVRAATGLPLIVHPRAEQAALDAGAVFELALEHSIAITAVCNLLSEQAGAEVEWTVRHGAVLFTSSADARGESYLVSYDVRAHVQPMSDFIAPSIAELSLLDEQGDESTPVGGVGGTQQSWDEGALATLVQEVIEPSSWDADDVGIQAEGGFLFVRQTGAVHRKVRAFLDSLR